MKFSQVNGIAPPNDPSYMPTATRMVSEVMLQSHPLLQFLDFYTHIGNADTPRSMGVSTGGTYRALEGDYSASAATPQFGATALKVFGDSFTADQAYIRRSIDIAGYINDELKVFAEQIALNLAEQFVHGDVTTPTHFDGIAELCPAAQKVPMGTDGASFPLGNSDANRTDQQEFMEALDLAISMARGGTRFIIMSSKLHSRISSVWREAFRWQAGPAVPGEMIPYYNGIPIIPAGYAADGDPILPSTEEQGTSGAVCTSLYVVATGEKTRFTVATNTGMNVYMSTASEKRRVTVEGDFCPVLLDSKAISAVTGIIL